MNFLDAGILGFVEGVTELLPVSSTGHLILVSTWRGITPGAFEIVIQFGALLAVLVYYWKLILEHLRGLFRGAASSRRLLVALMLGFAPVAVAGLLTRHWIKENIFGPKPVVIALVVGGVVMAVVELWRRKRNVTGLDGLEHVTPWRALVIGLAQCFSLWPGTSRSMSTIVAGQLTGLSTATAAEFSFLLALPTLGAACVYEGWKSRHELLGMTGSVAIGLVMSFVVTLIVITAFLRWLKKHGLLPFAVYRIALGAALFFLLWR
jgi:undecaprenyl-diphosphatase